MNPHRLGTPRRRVFALALAAALLATACTPQPSGTQDAEPVHAARSEGASEPAPDAPDRPAASLPASEESAGDAGARPGSPWSLPYPDAPGDIAANGLLVVVNKANQLVPHDYRPASLVRVSGHYVAEVAAESLRDLLAAARNAGLELRTRSGFRSYARQRRVHADVAATLGQARADEQVLRAGHSEHQTGLGVDLLPMYGHPCYDFACFGETPHAAWLAEHSWEFGWIVRYKPGMEHLTGVTWEPWHLRYLGREAAAAYHLTGATGLEEFLGLPAAPDYLD